MQNDEIKMTTAAFEELRLEAVRKFLESGQITLSDLFCRGASDRVEPNYFLGLKVCLIDPEFASTPASRRVEIDARQFYEAFGNRTEPPAVVDTAAFITGCGPAGPIPPTKKMALPQIVSARVDDSGNHVVACLLTVMEMSHLLRYQGCGKLPLDVLALR